MARVLWEMKDRRPPTSACNSCLDRYKFNAETDFTARKFYCMIQLLYGATLRAVVFKRKATHDKVIREGELVRII